MRITLTVNGNELAGTFGNGAATRDFAALLPLPLAFTDFTGASVLATLPEARRRRRAGRKPR